jgi:hypothetical protein
MFGPQTLPRTLTAISVGGAAVLAHTSPLAPVLVPAAALYGLGLWIERADERAAHRAGRGSQAR